MVLGLLFESILHYVLVFGGSAQDSNSLYQQNCNTGAENLNTSCWTNKCMVHRRYERKTKQYKQLLKIKSPHIVLLYVNDNATHLWDSSPRLLNGSPRVPRIADMHRVLPAMP